MSERTNIEGRMGETDLLAYAQTVQEEALKPNTNTLSTPGSKCVKY